MREVCTRYSDWIRDQQTLGKEWGQCSLEWGLKGCPSERLEGIGIPRKRRKELLLRGGGERKHRLCPSLFSVAIKEHLRLGIYKEKRFTLFYSCRHWRAWCWHLLSFWWVYQGRKWKGIAAYEREETRNLTFFIINHSCKTFHSSKTYINPMNMTDPSWYQVTLKVPPLLNIITLAIKPWHEFWWNKLYWNHSS
jgi:hypothetical protein